MLQNIKGMPDILPSEIGRWHALEQKIRQKMIFYGFDEIRTPLLEDTDLFVRSVGEVTDIVQKETYTFSDRNGDSLTLRPEGTASVVRALVQHHLHLESATTKLFYMGPMFRHERPQKGRFRQFHQMGAEVFGEANPRLDVETMQILVELCRELDIENPTLEINSVGDRESRKNFNEKLKIFLMKNESKLDVLSRTRIEKNPMRVFDSKDEHTQLVLADAPSILDHLSDGSLKYFEGVQEGLTLLKIPFRVNAKIVRGLDYYTDTVFEVLSSGLGAQNVIGGGGRYDHLVEELGGRSTPAVGFATGLERLLMASRKLEMRSYQKIVFLPLGIEQEKKAIQLLKAVREKLSTVSCTVDIVFGKEKMKTALKTLDRLKTDYAVILGEQEMTAGAAAVKNMNAHLQTAVAFEDLPKHFFEILKL